MSKLTEKRKAALMAAMGRKIARRLAKARKARGKGK